MTDFSISGEYVTRVLDQATTFHGFPDTVLIDNGPEFAKPSFMAWAQHQSVSLILIQPGRHMQNGYIERFNGKFHDECGVGRAHLQAKPLAQQGLAASA